LLTNHERSVNEQKFGKEDEKRMVSRQITDSPLSLVDQEQISDRMSTFSEKLQGISVVIPTLNESGNIALLLRRLDAAMTRASIPYEAIVVDDHSQDCTGEVALRVAQDNHLPVRVLTKRGQPGKAFSLMEGFAVAQYNVLAALDGDLQYPPETIIGMMKKLQDADIVVADRRVTYSRTDRFRGTLSSIFTTIINLLFGLDTDIQSGLKVFRRTIYEEMESQPGKWSFDLHLVTHAIHHGYAVANVPILFEQRPAGESKVTPLAVAAELLMTALQLKLKTGIFHQTYGAETSRKQQEGHAYIITADVPIAEQVKYYTQWLRADMQSGYFVNSPQAIASYKEIALRTAQVNGKGIATFAPFNQKLSAFRTFTLPQILFLGMIILLLCLGAMLFPTQTMITAIALVTIFYFGELLVNFLLAVHTLSVPCAEVIDDEMVYALKDADWPAYTVLCPLYHEAAVVPQFVKAMQDLQYPPDKLQVIFLTEQEDDETRDAIRAMDLPAHFMIVTVPDGQPRTKPRACNYGLLHARGRYVVIYDAEDCPDPLQLKKAVLTFANHGPDVACVQAKLNFYNAWQNLLTRWFTAEYSLWFDLTLPGLQRAGFSLPLGGTSNHFRIELLRKIGAWDAFNVTEDCDLGLRLSHYKLKTVVLDSTTYEEANSQVRNWIRQRSRWIKGYMQTYLVYMRNPSRYLHPQHWNEFLSLQLIVGGKTAVLFINPLMWLLLVVYVLGHHFVGEIYHTLFPTPVLYMGTACLIFGNFFYIYTHLFGCLKRNRYSLLKWTLLIPLYWLLTSMAGCVALLQLIFKTNYWEKTQHGLHLQPSHNSTGGVWEAIAKEQQPASSVTEAQGEDLSGTKPYKKRLRKMLLVPFLLSGSQPLVKSMAASIKMVFAVPLPVIHRKSQPQRRLLSEDPWLTITLVIACIVSIAAMWFFFSLHQTLLYGDAYAHMAIARRLFDSATPGLAQLGGVWLPLPHLVMVPFIWNDTLWRTGVAGSIPSMICYIIASVYIFLSARRLTRDSQASFIGTLLFMLNPNMLYLQTTPLSELVLTATLTMTCYYFLAWVQEEDTNQLIKAAIASFLATLARYDGWSLFFVLAVLVVVIGRQKGHRWAHIEGNLLVFCSLGGLGIGLWLLWCSIIFGDPLYFLHGPFSAQAQQAELLKQGVLFTYHNLPASILVYLAVLIKTIGPGLAILDCISLLIFLVNRRTSPELLVMLAFLAPLVFYVSSLYSGQAALFVPGAVPAHSSYTLFNVRYGAEAVAPASLFLAFLARLFSGWKKNLRFLSPEILVAIIMVQSALVATTGIITLQDGQSGTSCFASHPIEFFLVQHYNGGRILTDDYTAQDDALEPEAGIHFENIIYEGSSQLWDQALKKPAALVDWIIVNPSNRQDLVANQLMLHPVLLSPFTRVVQEQNGLSLYHKNGTGHLPTRLLPSYLLTEHSLCHSTASLSETHSQAQRQLVLMDILSVMQEEKKRS
jgi:cellulose synthase/poly-beta-1,6-N-acetylglucosamine synthase-like glycosyltransferase